MIRKNKKQEANKFSWDDSSNQTVGQFVKYLDNIQVKIRINGTKVYCEIPKKYYSPKCPVHLSVRFFSILFLPFT